MQLFNVSKQLVVYSDGSEPRLSSGSTQGSAFFGGALDRYFEKGPGLIQARAWLFEKGPENWSFYGVKIEAHQGSGSTFSEGPKLGPGSSLTLKARAQPGLIFLGLDPSLVVYSIEQY